MPDKPATLVEFLLPATGGPGSTVASAVGVAEGDVQRWSREDGECPDDLRSTIGHALREATDGAVDPWAYLPRAVEHGEDHILVRLAIQDEVYSGVGEQPEVAESPEQRVLSAIEEWQAERDDNPMPYSAIVERTLGEQASVEAAIAELERRGEIYEPADGYYRITGGNDG